MKEIEIRTANPDDAEAIATVLASAFLEYEPLYSAKAYAATTPDASVIRSRFAEGEMWVAVFDSKVVGTISVVPQADSLYGRSMGVLPEALGHRIGERLMSEFERYAIDKGYKRLTLSTTPFLDRAVRLYEKFGFVRTGDDDLFGTPLIMMEKEVND